MSDLNYIGLSEKVAEKARREKQRSCLEALSWLDNLETLTLCIYDTNSTVKLSFGCTGLTEFECQYLTTSGYSKEWSQKHQKYT